jgi:hypothetical protein
MQVEVPAPQNAFRGAFDFSVAPRVNGIIATPTGAAVTFQIGRKCVLSDFVQDTTQFSISGQTVTGAGVSLGGCRVIVYESGRLEVDNIQAEVGETISDGSGNFTIPVPMNTSYQLTGYLTGTPVKAGITLNTIVPTTTGTLIYMRDPTVPDGPAGSAAYRPIGSAVVRRIDG